MNKILLIGCLILTSACQPATQTPAPSFFPTSTPTPIPFDQTQGKPAPVSPEPSPTLGPTSTPFPRLFTNEFDSSLAGWAILQAGNTSTPNIKIEKGSLVLQMDSPYTWLYALYGAQDYANIHTETQFTNRALTPSSTGLICRYSEDQGWFEFNIFADGTYNVLFGRWLSVGIVEYLPIADGTSNEILPTGTTQTIGLTCADTTLSLFINETRIRNVNVENYNLAEGKIGITASSYENIPIVVGFDWVMVSEP